MGIVLITYIPFGVYNPGSAIRYASSFLLFLTLPAMLLSAVAAELEATAQQAGRQAPAWRPS